MQKKDKQGKDSQILPNFATSGSTSSQITPGTPDDLPVITSDPVQSQKIQISAEQVLNFRILKLKEQIITLKEENLELLRQKTEIEKENLKLRKDSLMNEQQSFFRQNHFAPGDKIVPASDGKTFYIHRPMLERFSVGLSKDQDIKP